MPAYSACGCALCHGRDRRRRDRDLLAGTGFYLVDFGAAQAHRACQAEALRKENDELAAELAEERRALALINAIAERDASRAATAEDKLRANEEAIRATPKNPAQCFDRAATGRARRVR
ncbi:MULTISPECIES: hypothetical protein [unclassified Bradyrhizobium]|uniref:hypothetical protein n=1 Tax=unclassified Bradyrhizobium TaxID=2631580 RepID=UPI002916AE54|nr:MULTISPECIES: hypothetical protein [unclassified Bradyrhizobium]